MSDYSSALLSVWRLGFSLAFESGWPSDCVSVSGLVNQ